MKPIRFSTRAMLIAFACVGVALTALARPASVTVSIASALWFGTILVAPLGIIYRNGATRAFWVGVAVFGWGQILSERMLGSAWRPIINQPVQWLHRLYFGTQPATGVQSPMFPPTPVGLVPGQAGVPGAGSAAPTLDGLFGPPGPSMMNEFQTRQGNFTEIGISFGMIVIALLGGVLAIYFYRTRERPDADRDVPGF
jgi:hypothetical protein